MRVGILARRRGNLMKDVLAVTLLTISTLCAISLTTSVAQESSQTPDPNFDTRVGRPAYTKKRPRVLFDEAHFNVHTTGTGYKAFAEMMTNDFIPGPNTR